MGFLCATSTQKLASFASLYVEIGLFGASFTRYEVVSLPYDCLRRSVYVEVGLECVSFMSVYVEVGLECVSFMSVYVEVGLECVSFMSVYVEVGLECVSFMW